MAEFEARSSVVVIPTPPRFTGQWEQDVKALQDWQQRFYIATVQESGLLDPSYQASGGEGIEADNLPDPTATTIARAQATANLAVTMVEALGELWGSRIIKTGNFTVENTSDLASVVFDVDLGHTDYRIMHAVETYAGAPSLDAFRVIAITKGTGGFTAEVTAAPGAGTSVTFAYTIVGDF
jgi:hypothetical protein